MIRQQSTEGSQPIPPALPSQRLGTHPWYRNNWCVTLLVGGILLMGPLVAPFVLAIVLSGPVYYARPEPGGAKTWEASTKAMVILFSVAVTALWVWKVWMTLTAKGN